MPFPPWLIAIVTHIGFKVISIILLVALVALALFSWIKLHDSKVRAAALLTCPKQNIISGDHAVIDQRIMKMTCFPLHIGRFGLGVCHD